MENLFTVHAESRQETGKRIAKKLRTSGKIPAIIYGRNEQSLPVVIDLSEIKEILHSDTGENSILRIQLAGKPIDAMIKEIQYDYLSTRIIHADFIRIDLNKPVVVEVAIVLEGEAVGIKLEDGILDFVSRHVEVRCLPTQIPNSIAIDISGLHVGQSFKVEGLPKLEGVEYISSPQAVICSVVEKGKEEEVAPAAAVAPEGVVAPEGAAAAEAAASAAPGVTKGATAAPGAAKGAAAAPKEKEADKGGKDKKEKEG